ncbi:hypothetical protein LCGC14_2795200 [marine sediment metagenome]|uniref:Right handed beta helix domain-containing protein n=1 Tax=marine sediment metagenome TaxID=412755 RepID=A0A0F9BFQ8_9ZZZZ
MSATHFSGPVFAGGVMLGAGGGVNYGQPVGDVFHVDASLGSDGGSGESWDDPLLTWTRALALATDGADDYIIGRGNFSEDIAITKSKIHLLGLLGGGGRSYLTRINNGGSDSTILVQAVDVEISNLIAIGNRDVGKHYPAIELDGDNGGTRAHVHHCFLTMLTPSATKYTNGITITSGDRQTIEFCVIDSCMVGVLVNSAVQTTYEIIVRNNLIYACNKGIHLMNLQFATGQFGCAVLDNRITGQGAESATNGIDVDAAATGAFLVDNKIAGYGTPIVNDGSAVLIENYSQAAGGTLINV